MHCSDTIKVSVVMPIYNAYSYLRPALDSVLDQTLTELELICVDDGSTDHSLDILREYQERDSRVRIVCENNAGPSFARNKGLARARGEYVIFLDADDFFELTLLETLYTKATTDRLDIAIAEYDIYNDFQATFESRIKSDMGEVFLTNNIVSKKEFPDSIFQCTSSYVWNKLFRREFLNEKELTFHQDLRVFEDVYFVTTTLSMADRIGKVHDVLIHHRVYSEQSKQRFFRRYFNQVPEMFLKIKEFLMSRGVFAPLYRSFLNLSGSRLFKVYNILWIDAKGFFWESLHKKYAEALGWEKANPEEINSPDVREFIANTLLYNHMQYLRRTSKGISVRLEEVGKKLRSLKIRQRIADFFAWMFGKKKEK